MDVNTNTPLEIERKWLVEYPDLDKLPEAQSSEIVQTYLSSPTPDIERRVRKRITSGITEYFYTEKVPTENPAVREEKERIITKEEYDILIQEADPSLHTIEKVRYSFPHLGLIFELDVYSFDKHLAVLEVELPSVDTEFEFPDFILCILEVTSYKSFKNKSIAKTLRLAVDS